VLFLSVSNGVCHPKVMWKGVKENQNFVL